MLIEFHRRMLADEVRSAAFESALRRVIVPGSTTVADIGAGTGVLAFMAQRLGAREVHLIEHGAVIELAARLADANRIQGLHFWQAHSADIFDPPQADVVVAEILGNLALEENALETLADARRFLKPGGILIPCRIEQFAAPVVTDRFWRELASWERAPMGLDFGAARAMSFDNLYVRPIAPSDLLPLDEPGRQWDAIDFLAAPGGRRRGAARWDLAAPATIYGFALWWRCELVPGVSLATSPFAPATHWEQVYAPVGEPLEAVAGDVVEVEFESETGGGEAGIGMRWRATQLRGGRARASRQQDIGRGFIG
jgi:protein arginine N-methyltransferase 1